MTLNIKILYMFKYYELKHQIIFYIHKTAVTYLYQLQYYEY